MDYSLLKDEELVGLYKNNDDAAVTVLTGRYMKVASIIANRFNEYPLEKADVIQEAMLAFLYAVFSYNNEKGCSFKTYASVCMRNRIISLIRNLSRGKRIPDSLTVSFDDSNELPVIPSPEEKVMAEGTVQYISSVTDNCLTKKEKQVFSLFLTGISYEAIAKQLGITAKAVDGTLQRARKKLRKKLNNYK